MYLKLKCMANQYIGRAFSKAYTNQNRTYSMSLIHVEYTLIASTRRSHYILLYFHRRVKGSSKATGPSKGIVTSPPPGTL